MNSKNMLKIVGAALILSAGSASAAELLLTPAASKSGNTNLALDVVSDGEVSGFQFSIALDKAQAASVDLSKCVSDLPKGFSGECGIGNGKLTVIAMANGMTTLPAGAISVGSLGFPRSAAKAAQDLVIGDVEFVDVKGNPVKVSQQIAK